MLTFQDFENETDKAKFVSSAIAEHIHSEEYEIAKSAEAYDHQKNETVYNYVRTIFSLLGTPIEDFTASNNKIASNFFHRLNTQRCEYLLGNGVSFSDHTTEIYNEENEKTTIDETKEMLGKRFDNDLKELVYNGLIHGVSYGYWVEDSIKGNRLYTFKLTEFKSLLDEETGALRAGIRFWQIDSTKPMFAVLYEEDGYTKFRSENGYANFIEIQPKRTYKRVVNISDFDGEVEIGGENYTSIPIIPFYGSKLKQSTLVGMRNAIDSFDLIRSGFANDLSDCAQIYWLLENCSGMSDAEIERFRDRLKFNHIAVADTDNSKVTPYTQEIPYQARKEYLDHIRAGIYEDFGGLDVHTIAAGATNDHIDAAYQPMDEEADDLEYQVIEFITTLLEMLGVEDTPIFKRNRISNQKEQTDMVLSAADYLDDETILSKLPFITVDEIYKILSNKDAEDQETFSEEDEEEIEDEELGDSEETDDIDTQLEALLAELEEA